MNTAAHREDTEYLGPGITRPEPGLLQMDVHVPGMHCAGCISKIERGLKAHHGVQHARVSLSTKRVMMVWREDDTKPDELTDLIVALGFETHPIETSALNSSVEDTEKDRLLRSLAVAGFAAGNIMLLSVSVWSGAQDATRDLFHWISALIAMPAIVYAGRPFYQSAWRAVRSGHLNMDVPISLAVILAFSMSIYQTYVRAEQVYFDAAVTLLFFLLIGRTLDHLMRAKARSAVSHLVNLAAKRALLIKSDGGTVDVAVQSLSVGDRVLVPAGGHVPVDGKIVHGISDVDQSFVSGEALPKPVKTGDEILAGMINLTGPLEFLVTAVNNDTYLAQIIRLMEAAEQGKARYVKLADRAARLYAPMVHILAGATFIGWLAWGVDWQTALFTAIAVLIITCPCALGLAVPVVQIIASGRLFNNGIMVKDGAGLEKLSEVDTIIFDKTGTLTRGHPRLVQQDTISADMLALAAGLSGHSLHPLSRALTKEAENRDVTPAKLENIKEHPGKGLTGHWQGKPVKLGQPEWCGIDKLADIKGDQDLMMVALRIDRDEPLVFLFEDQLRDDAGAVIHQLRDRGFNIEILSGDRHQAVAGIAETLGIETYSAPSSPDEKVRHIEQVRSGGHKVLMVGDGINDGPALAAAYTSMAPASASDVGRVAADFVIMGDRLAGVATALDTARRAQALIKQNFALAIVYNIIAVPVAALGFASPMVAAIAMSSSSILVVGNALRLKIDRPVLRFATCSKFTKPIKRMAAMGVWRNTA